MRLEPFLRNFQANQSPILPEAQQLDGAGEKFGAFAHSDQANAGLGRGREATRPLP